MNAPKTLRIKSPGDLLAAVPSALGFHPDDSLVILTVGSTAQPFFARVDLPWEASDIDEVVDQLADVATRHARQGVAVVVYSDDPRHAEAASAPLLTRLGESGVPVPLAVRADGERWFWLAGSIVPTPDEDGGGTPYDVAGHPFTLEAVVEGRVVHDSREALADSLVTSDPDEVEEVAAAMEAAVRRLQGAARHPLGPPDPAAGRSHLVAEGRWVQQRVRRFVMDGRRLDAHEVGRLVVAVGAVDVRDVAWAEMTRARAGAHVDLWRDVVRRAPHNALAAPAALLAFAAWLSGDGALAWCAVDRSQEAEPGYGMASLVAQALAGAVPPSAWEPLAPEALTLFAG